MDGTDACSLIASVFLTGVIRIYPIDLLSDLLGVEGVGIGFTRLEVICCLGENCGDC